MIPTALLILIFTVILRSPGKSIFFFRMVKKGLINPNQEDLQRLSQILKDKRHPPFFSFVFKEVLFMKIKIFLRHSESKGKFINSVNFILRNVERYPFDQEKLHRRMARILNRYDTFLQRSIYSYRSPKPIPVIELLRNISKVREHSENFLYFSFLAIKDTLMILIGKPLVHSKLNEFALDESEFRAVEYVFDDSQKTFIDSLYQIRSVA